MPNPAIAPLSIGLDDGYAYTKIALTSGRVFAVPSRARLGAAGITALNQHHAPVREYLADGLKYSAGAVDGESTSFDDYPVSCLNRVIVQHALFEAGLSGKVLHAVSGLPLNRFYHADGAKRHEFIAQKIANLKHPVRGEDEVSPAEIAFHDVIPEALAAWYDEVITETPEGVQLETERMQSPVAVIDIGGRTTDYVVVAEQAVIHRSSGSLRCGLLDVKQRIADHLRAQFDLESLDERLVDDAIHHRRIRLYGETHDIADLIEVALREVVEKIHSETRRQLGRGAELERIVFVGGGALVLDAHIRHWFPNQHIAPMPAFANARGMLKYLKYVARESVC